MNSLAWEGSLLNFLLFPFIRARLIPSVYIYLRASGFAKVAAKPKLRYIILWTALILCGGLKKISRAREIIKLLRFSFTRYSPAGLRRAFLNNVIAPALREQYFSRKNYYDIIYTRECRRVCSSIQLSKIRIYTLFFS